MDWRQKLLHTRLRMKNVVMWFVNSELVGAFFEWLFKVLMVYLALGLFYRWTTSMFLVSIGILAVAEYFLKWGLKYAKARAGGRE